MVRKLTSGPAWLIAVAMMAGGFVLGSDSPCTFIVNAQQAEAEAPGAAEDDTRTRSVTLLVRGMMKSRSGAT